MIHIDGIPGRTAESDGKEYLFFSGFAYLGMPSLPAFQQLISEAAASRGAVFPSSRISNTRSPLFDAFEEKLSAFTGLPASASFSSGYMASQAAVHYAAQNSKLLYSPRIHPSLLVAGHAAEEFSPQHWQQQIIAKINHDKDKLYTVVTESVNPLSGKIQDFSWLKQVRHPIRLLIDDSHGIGMLGERGEGIIAFLPSFDHVRILICYSLSKAFSCEGGAVSGDEGDIAGIRKLPWFTAATGMSPLFMSAWINGQDLFRQQMTRLKNNIACLGKKAAGLPAMQHDARLPVCYINEPDLYEHCLKYRIILSAFRYPSEQDALMARIVLNALHTAEDIDRLVGCIREFYAAGR